MNEPTTGHPPFPAVARDSGSGEFFDAAGRGELLVQRCGSCSTVHGPEIRTCWSCGGVDLGQTIVSGLGRLVSWVVVHQAPIPVLRGAVPYVSAVVELDEGPWLLARLVGDGAPAVDGRVQVDFVRSGSDDEPGELLPVFRLIDEEAA